MSANDLITIITSIIYFLFPFMSIFSPNYFDNSLKIETAFLTTDQYFADKYAPSRNDNLDTLNIHNKIEKGIGIYLNTNLRLSKKLDFYVNPGYFMCTGDYFSTLNFFNINFRYNIDKSNGLSIGLSKPLFPPYKGRNSKYKTFQFDFSYDRKLNDELRLIVGFKKPLEKYFFTRSDDLLEGKINYKYAFKFGIEYNF